MYNVFTDEEYYEILLERFGYYNPFTVDEIKAVASELNANPFSIWVGPRERYLRARDVFCYVNEETELKKLYLSPLNETDNAFLLHTCAEVIYQGDDGYICRNAPDKDGNTVEMCLITYDKTGNMKMSEDELHDMFRTNRVYLAIISSALWRIAYYLEDGRLKRESLKDDSNTDSIGIFLKTGAEIFYNRCKFRIPSTVPKKQQPSFISFWHRCHKYCKNMTLDEIEGYFNEHMDQFIYEPYVDPYKNEKITKISAPQIIRFNDNKNTKTFDKIRVEVFVLSMSKEELKQYFLEYKKKILGFVYRRIENNTRYQSYGIPVQFLKLYSVGIGSASNLILDFEIREI